MIPVHLYDSRSKQLREVKMDENNKTYLYVCGPTVYNHAHIGNARPLMVFDTLRRTLKEFRMEDVANYNVGDEIKVDTFEIGDKVDVSGVSKGKGFQGTIKRWNASRGPMSHGSKFHRHQGSNGSATTPGRVFKGKGMPGHMGSVKVTTQNLEVVRVDADKNLLLIKGAVPGAKKALITVKETTKSGK